MLQRTLLSGGFEAEFFVELEADPPVVHYIVTKKGSPGIVAWGQEKSTEEAECSALDCIHDLYQRAVGRAAAG